MIPSSAYAVGLAGVVLLGIGSAQAEEPLDDLPALSATSGLASVVGVSSGGYMAQQLAVAWPDRFSGLGVVAAGPWGCAQGQLGQALYRCMTVRDGLPSLAELDQRWQGYAEQHRVGSDTQRGQLRVFVWHGSEDTVIAPELGSLLGQQWRHWLADPQQLHVVEGERAGHGWPTRAQRADDELDHCQSPDDSHVLACGTDMAGDMLAWLYPGRDAIDEMASDDGQLVAFDQANYAAKGLADTGYLFIPSGCEEGGCTTTLALHGCQMSANVIGDTFVRHSGLNRWAATHRQVVLYPQAESTLANPQGCWDWWGFSESAWQPDPLHDSREGRQAKALISMLDRLESSADEPR